MQSFAVHTCPTSSLLTSQQTSFQFLVQLKATCARIHPPETAHQAALELPHRHNSPALFGVGEAQPRSPVHAPTSRR